MKRYGISLAVFFAIPLLMNAMPEDEKEQPRIKTSADVEYPMALKNANIEGEVWLRVVIDEKGKPTSFDVVKASNSAFVPAAVAAVKKMEFEPAEKNGHAVAAEAVLPFKWVLKEKSVAPDQSLEDLKSSLLRCFHGETLKNMDAYIDANARIILGGQEEALLPIRDNMNRVDRFLKESGSAVSSSEVDMGPDGRSAIIIVRTRQGSGKKGRLHSIEIVRTEMGTWKVRFWHAS
jgi:TonB family protein